MPINGLSTTKYYERLGVNPFAITTIEYPRSDGVVILSEDTNYKITHPTSQYNARMGTSIALSGDGTRLLVGMPEGANYEDTTFSGTATGRVQAYFKLPSFSTTTWSPIGAIEFTGLGGYDDATGAEDIGTYVAISKDGETAATSNLTSNLVEIIGPGGRANGTITTDNTPGPLALNGNGKRIVIGMPYGGPSTAHGKVMVYGLREIAPGSALGGYHTIGNSLTGAANNDNFGSEVCINDVGNIIGVGIAGGDTAGTNFGGVKVYKLIGTTWTQIGQTLDLFSQQKVTSLDMNATGDTICIGSALNQPPGANEPVGEISVYKFDGAYWNLLGEKIIYYSAATTQLGHAAAMSSDGYTIVVSNGASTLTSGSFNETIVVYRYNGSDWKSVGSFVGPSNTAQNGYSVAISSDGKIVVAGAPGTNSNRGEVRYFTLNV